MRRADEGQSSCGSLFAQRKDETRLGPVRGSGILKTSLGGRRDSCHVSTGFRVGPHFSVGGGLHESGYFQTRLEPDLGHRRSEVTFSRTGGGPSVGRRRRQVPISYLRGLRSRRVSIEAKYLLKLQALIVVEVENFVY